MINLMGWACALKWHDWRIELDRTREYTYFIERCSWCRTTRDIWH